MHFHTSQDAVKVEFAYSIFLFACAAHTVHHYGDFTTSTYSESGFATQQIRLDSRRGTMTVMNSIIGAIECICSWSKSFEWSWLWRDSHWEVEHKLTENRSIRHLQIHAIVLPAPCMKMRHSWNLLKYWPRYFCTLVISRNGDMSPEDGSTYCRELACY